MFNDTRHSLTVSERTMPPLYLFLTIVTHNCMLPRKNKCQLENTSNPGCSCPIGHFQLSLAP